MYAAVALLQRWPHAPKITLRYFVALAALTVLGLLFEVAEGTNSARSLGQVMGAVGSLAAWSAYLLKSERVRNTYDAAHGAVQRRRSVAVFCAVGLATLLMWIGTSVYSQAELRTLQQFDNLFPHQYVRAARQLESDFDRGFANGAIQRIQAATPDSTLRVAGDAEFMDFDNAVRGRVRLEGEMGADSGTAMVVGEVRSFFHAGGIAAIEAYCVPDLVDCSGIDGLLREAEEALVTRLSGTQLSGILPVGNCSMETVPDPVTKTPTQIAMCGYGDPEGAWLSLARSSLEETRRGLTSRLTPNPQFRKQIVRLATNAR
jgi:hypothetical protein